MSDKKLDGLAIQGGKPVRARPWPTYDKGFVFIHEEDVEAALRALKSHRYFRYDDRPFHTTEVGRFEARLCEYFDVKHALACTSGTTAIALGLMGAGIKPGDTVAVNSFTFVATPSAIVMAGAKPLLIDSTPDLHFDIDDLKRKFTPDVKAIVVVHMRGIASDVEEIVKFADEMHVPIIEDAVPAMGVSLRGKKLGTFGLVGAFSTQSDKTLNTGEGGFLVTNDSEVFAKAIIYCGAYEKRFKYHFAHRGQIPRRISDLDYPVFAYRMDDIRAALASSQMDRMDEHLQILQENYAYLMDKLKSRSDMAIRQPVAPQALRGESLIFRLPEQSPEVIDWVVEALRFEGISARTFGSATDLNARAFWNWRFLFPHQSPEEVKEICPNTARYLEESVDIPLSPTLTRHDCDDLVLALDKVLDHLAKGEPLFDAGEWSGPYPIPVGLPHMNLAGHKEHKS